MSSAIHPTAVLDPSTQIGRGVVVGPYAVVGPGVQVGDGARIAPHAVIVQNAVLGPECEIGIGAVIGSEPQDAKYQGEPTRVEIGERTRIREYVTVSRGTSASGRTVIGRGCYLMAYAHVGHDCVLEDDVTLANLVQLGGHVHVEEHVSIGGSSAIHQFARIGAYAFVGGGSNIRQDVPPYAKVSGDPVKVYGVNSVGLRRACLRPDARLALKHAFRLLFNSDLTTSEAIERLQTAGPDSPEVSRLLEFFARSERGVLV